MVSNINTKLKLFKNLYFLDCETGGIKSYINGISSINIQNWSKSYNRTIYFTPQKKIYDYRAIATNALSLETLHIKGVPKSFLIDEFREIVLQSINPKKENTHLIIVGYNIQFDLDFIMQIYKDNKETFPVPIVSVDLLEIAKINIHKKDNRKIEDEGIENYKLVTVYNYYYDNIKEEKAHTCEYDVFMTKKIFEKFLELDYINLKLLK